MFDSCHMTSDGPVFSRGTARVALGAFVE